MHVHAVNRAASSYEHIQPESVGNERRVLVSELSGRSNIIAKTTKYNLEQDKELMTKILEEVVVMENRGYQFEAAEASFDLLVQRCAGTYQSHFAPLKYHIEVVGNGLDNEQAVTTQATVKVQVGDDLKHEVSEGDGPVNALDAALRKALEPSFPNLQDLRLLDYKVRVVNSEAGTAARIRVIIESADESGRWGTVGVSENIIDASWLALLDSIQYKLAKDQPAAKAAAKA
jgi:2-isopropylmalate synthase